jgi:hypothetical protein
MRRGGALASRLGDGCRDALSCSRRSFCVLSARPEPTTERREHERWVEEGRGAVARLAALAEWDAQLLRREPLETAEWADPAANGRGAGTEGGKRRAAALSRRRCADGFVGVLTGNGATWHSCLRCSSSA